MSISTITDTLKHAFGLVEAFRAFDSNNDGLISPVELQGLMESLGYETSVQDMDGLMRLEEFLAMNMEGMDIGIAGSLRDALQELDEEDGLVTAEELYQVLVGVDGVSLGDCMSIITAIDGDGDGSVSLEELRLILDAML
ncbi:putative calcium-binding protein CML29 [Acorus gramineus]|uniref:Calcium-binding protein CML29 n=1 Tax=Acorus gramineus TaxID=55184 RepID=A0AAV9BV67_ACOGR|nr:putative calcium-binding protein CML29 [Acorus gramineus]